ncbi:MAG: LacI family DNA-binding transcriptional regulator [Spirochaetales bacterium]|nr:LacI family DNA-binding transcriptional regulator [Spirochaetales bacterium]
MARRVTIKDVAKKVGVTATTVSMVINNNPSISTRTRDKVLKAIEDLNYYPNHAARSLVKRKTNTIAILAEFFYPLFYQQLLDGIEHRVIGSPYSFIHFATLASKPIREKIFREILYGRVADVLISFNRVPPQRLLTEYIKEKYPLVVIEHDVPGLNSVLCDNFIGGYKATEFLIKQGRKNIYCVSPRRIDAAGGSDVQIKRVEGFKKALEDHGMDFSEERIIETTHFYFEAGKECYNSVLKDIKGLDAVFAAAGDPVAIGIIHAAQNDKVMIPDDLAVIGYDDLEVAAFINPPLTTIMQPGKQMGIKAVEIALSYFDDDINSNVHKIVFEPELVIRESV